LNHLEDLGANVIYFTPFFPGKSTHRYDASTFDHVDPLLGGDEAFAHLCKTAHGRNIRVMGDITLNHSGAKHEWFLKALEGHPIFSDFYTFNPSYEHGYASWLGVKSLPKFNYKSDSLKEILISEHDSIIRKWLREPFSMDGWRVDVANMSGRQGELDLTHEVARITRHAMEDEGDDKLLIAEHFHDAGQDLDGDGWHGSMNYAAFMKPVWNWLVSENYEGKWLGLPTDVPSFSGPNMVNSIKSFSSRMPWRSYLYSWSLLDSHDTARIRSVVGRERHHVAATMLMTLPGTPMIFQGDEIGAEGLWGEDARTTFPWDKPDKWDMETFELYKSLINLRKSNSALIDGGLRWVHIADDVICYLRETEKDRILVAVSRNPVDNVTIDLKRASVNSLENLIGTAKLANDGTFSIDGAGIGIWSVK
jgi:alpha-glucosidase